MHWESLNLSTALGGAAGPWHLRWRVRTGSKADWVARTPCAVGTQGAGRRGTGNGRRPAFGPWAAGPAAKAA
jgi:hypothetical protein